jgi:MarR family transcriptional regulator, organic hydroperoxide resistance regulator
MTSRKSVRSVPPVRLEQQVCFSLHAAARAYDALYRELLAPYGLSYPQYLALIVLGQRGQSTVKELGEALRLDSGTLSPMLKRMQVAGLVDRRRDLADERRVVVALTETGRERLAAVSGVQREVARVSGLGTGDLERLMGVLRATTAAVDAHLAGIPA